MKTVTLKTMQTRMFSALLLTFVFTSTGNALTCNGLSLQECRKLAKDTGTSDRLEYEVVYASENTSSEFVPAYTDSKNGVIWSRKLDKMYSNGCKDTSSCGFTTDASGERFVKVEESDAAKACLALGARLPTMKDVRNLILNFDPQESVISETGIQPSVFGQIDMQYYFGRWSFGNLHTASVSSDDPSVAHVIHGHHGAGMILMREFVGSPTYRKIPQQVRCVRDI